MYNTKINQIEPGSSEPKTEGTPRKSQDAQSAEAIKESLKQLTQKEGWFCFIFYCDHFLKELDFEWYLVIQCEVVKDCPRDSHDEI